MEHSLYDIGAHAGPVGAHVRLVNHDPWIFLGAGVLVTLLFGGAAYVATHPRESPEEHVQRLVRENMAEHGWPVSYPVA